MRLTAPADIPLRDQLLDEEGHDDNCGVWDGNSCSGSPVCSATASEFPRPPKRKPRIMQAETAGPDAVTLTGPSAAAYRRYIAAMAELKVAKDMYAAAGQAAQAAHEEFLRLVVGAA